MEGIRGRQGSPGVFVPPMLCCLTCTRYTTLGIQGDTCSISGNESARGNLCTEKDGDQRGLSRFHAAKSLEKNVGMRFCTPLDSAGCRRC